MFFLYKFIFQNIALFFFFKILVIKNVKSQLSIPLDYLEKKYYQILYKNNNNNINLKTSQEMQRIFYNTLITKFEIGTPIQNIPLFIDMNTDDFYFKTINPLNNNISEITIIDSQNVYQFTKSNFYNEIFSQSYKEQNCKNINDYSGICLSNENIIFHNKTIIIKNEFPIKIMKNINDNIPGFLGLLYNNDYYNISKSFIIHLKEQKLINNYYWFFNIEKYSIFEIKAELVFGGLPHDIFPKKYSKEDLRFTNAKIIPNIYKSWRISFNKIYIDSIKRNYNLRDTIVTLASRIYNIIGTYEFNYLIKEWFMDKLIKSKKCFYNNFTQNIYGNQNFRFYYCDILVSDN